MRNIIKRTLAALLACCAMLPVVALADGFSASYVHGWDRSSGYQYLQFGRYEQDYPDQPILWRVLDVKDGRALLLSEYILDTRPFDADSNEWNSSSLRKWLNGRFAQAAFLQEELDAILKSKAGSVFLLARGDLSNPTYGFLDGIHMDDPARSAAGTAFAYGNGLWRVAGSEYTNYYARSKGNKVNVDLVTGSGKVMLSKIDRDNVGVRPAIWIDLSAAPLTGGSGTFGDPFQ